MVFQESQQDRQTFIQTNQKKQREEIRVNQIKNEKGDITTDTGEIQTIFWSYFESLYSTKFENSKEMDKFLHNYHQN